MSGIGHRRRASESIVVTGRTRIKIEEHKQQVESKPESPSWPTFL